ncbi:signal peptidase complex catalytic subunit Sec11 [Ceratobasidium sp. AG-Ba]|nr:signal peptidase complex catalytic subunit Sec11 [Ceratobasidium sp. AG-Ba]
MSDIVEQFPTGITPKTGMVGFYMTAVYVLLIGFCILLITAGKQETKETLVNGVGLRLVVVNWLMTAWAALWAMQLFLASSIVLGIAAVLLGWIMFSLIWFTPGGPLTRPFDQLFIHAPLKLWFLITLMLDFPLSLFIALGWNYPYTRPDMYARKQWEAFAFVVSMHTVGVIWVFIRQDLTVTLGGFWLVLSVMLQRPKSAPVFAATIVFAVLYPLTYISRMAWKRLKKHEEGRIALPPDEEEALAAEQANGNGNGPSQGDEPNVWNDGRN